MRFRIILIIIKVNQFSEQDFNTLTKVWLFHMRNVMLGLACVHIYVVDQAAYLWQVMRTVKVQTRLRECTVWSVALRFAYVFFFFTNRSLY